MSRRVNDYRTNEKEVMVLLDDLRVCEFLGLHAGVELCVLDADPLLRDDGDDVVPAHHLLALPPQVVDPELHVRHACNVYIPCTVYSTQRPQRAGQDRVHTAKEAEEEQSHSCDLLQHGALRVLLHVQLVHRRDLHLQRHKRSVPSVRVCVSTECSACDTSSIL